MNARPFVRNGIALLAGVLAVSGLVACGGDDGPMEPVDGDDPPTLTSVSPSSGEVGNTVDVTLTGTNFDVGTATVDVSGSGVTVENVSVGSATSITADFVIASGASTGPRDVTVSNDDGTSGSEAFTVESGSSNGSLTVEADDNFFAPTDLQVDVGETVTWDNVGSVDHTVTPDGHSEWSDQTLSPGETFQHTFNTAGTYDYVCTIHVGMDGTITVVQP